MKSRLLFLGLCAFFAGCGSKPDYTSDPNVARDSLKAALESWKKGEPITKLKDGSPSITIADWQWKSGKKLVDYKIGSDKTDGFNYHISVKLTFENDEGDESDSKATYTVATNPVITVIRE